MKFYARERELEILETQYNQVNKKSIMTVITGKKRIGKTSLSKLFAKNKKTLYLFISKKNEMLLCEEFVERIKEEFDIPVIGDIRDFRDVFRLIMEIGKKEKIVVIIDEFQEFFHINDSVYSNIQNHWDEYKNQSEVHLIFIGSIYSLLHKIFKNSKEPLFGRADGILYLKPFPPHVIKRILSDKKKYNSNNLFINYLLTGGVPRYQKYYIKDNFDKFWFRFVYKYRSAIENNNFQYIKKRLNDSLASYSGPILEKLYHEIYRGSGKYTEIGNYWEKGNQNEIDLVCIDEINKNLIIGEINMNNLREKSKKLIKYYRDYKIEEIGLGLSDIDNVLENESL